MTAEQREAVRWRLGAVICTCVTLVAGVAASEARASATAHGSTMSRTSTADPQLARASGAKSYLVKLATKLVAASFRHGGDVFNAALKHVDRRAARNARRYSDEVADELDRIAKIPDLTSNMVKRSLFRFLRDDLGLSGGTSLQIADGVKRTIDILVL